MAAAQAAQVVERLPAEAVVLVGGQETLKRRCCGGVVGFHVGKYNRYLGRTQRPPQTPANKGLQRTPKRCLFS